MQSLKQLYKIGNGPSSSHTMGPKKAAEYFKNKYNKADSFRVILYGSLAATGKGHLTDKIIKKVLEPIENTIIFDKETECKVHPNTMDFIAYKENKPLGTDRIYSIGGGEIVIEGTKAKMENEKVYKLESFGQIRQYCINNNKTIYEYVYKQEGNKIKDFLKDVWKHMEKAVEEGLNSSGTIPGKLKLEKRAKNIYENIVENETDDLKKTRLLTAYAYAVSETNASGGEIVTAPTCGSCGILPAVLYYMKKEKNYSDEEIVDALATAGIIGNLVKTNASISGAECGCQAEVGTACSMAAAACSQLEGLNINIIEHSAEIAMEHFLGLTCDPIYGYVQIPCIERNAVAALRAIDSCNMAKLLGDNQKIQFDVVVETMYETGKDLGTHYKETSEGGLAKKYCRNKYYNMDIE